ncbi:hypothetical protein FA95DRAFT_1678043 [Auriscalpium vulgare]|uniref:Uncharacterized protein n=1 Tax=Auriscalpium vulgare TaxID=40419 RepID=A0ACB8RX44_9AGAM|nr:hypothetical protein FA95DRAFT_1678043 [Auriscalpium vulgare]
MEVEYAWQPPVYGTTQPPKLVHQADLKSDPGFPENFARSAKWCPDGSLALAHCENRAMQYLDLPPELLDLTLVQASTPALRSFPQAAPVLDFAWYPRATPRDPSSFCFVASVKETPVKLLDASDGRLRASYKIVDHRERQVAPHSLAFNNSASKLYCGFEDAIEIFDLNYPGAGTRLATTPSRKSKDGLKGIVSALAFCPSYDPSYSLYAAGSLSHSPQDSANIVLLSEDTGDKPVGWVGDGTASVTQLAFNPMKPHILYASFRRRDAICSYDLRGDTGAPLQTFLRPAGSAVTNQRLRFDVDLSGRWLSVGDQQGSICVFPLDEGTSDEPAASESAAYEVGPALTYSAHQDAVGSVAFHPLRPLLLSVSGSRHFDLNKASRHPSPSTASSSSSDSGSDAGDEERGEAGAGSQGEGTGRRVRVPRRRVQPVARDASCRLWDFSPADKHL